MQMPFDRDLAKPSSTRNAISLPPAHFRWGIWHRPFNLALPLNMPDYFERMADWLAQQEITAYSVHPAQYEVGNSAPGRLCQREVAGNKAFLANLERLDDETA
jgi:hypothetical protein